MCLICPELGLLTRSKSALLIVDFGQPHARFLAKYLAGFFNREGAGILNIEIAPFPEIPEPAVLDHYDILITTVPGLLRLHRNGVLIDDYPSQANLCDIYGALVRITP